MTRQRPLGYWRLKENQELSPEMVKAITPVLERAVENGEQLVVTHGVVLQWVEAQPEGVQGAAPRAELDVERLRRVGHPSGCTVSGCHLETAIDEYARLTEGAEND